jgi:hypothetical protein
VLVRGGVIEAGRRFKSSLLTLDHSDVRLGDESVPNAAIYMLDM